MHAFELQEFVCIYFQLNGKGGNCYGTETMCLTPSSWGGRQKSSPDKCKREVEGHTDFLTVQITLDIYSDKSMLSLKKTAARYVPVSILYMGMQN